MRTLILLCFFIAIPVFSQSAQLQSIPSMPLNLHNRMNVSVILPQGQPDTPDPIIGPIPSSNVHHRVVNDFSYLDLHGNVDVTIKTGRPKSKLTLVGEPSLLQCTSAYVAENTLYIKGCIEDANIPKIQAIIEMRHLDRFTYQGYGNITANNINTNLETLSLDTSGKTLLTGKVRLNHLMLHRGYLEIKGTSSPHLSIDLFNDARAKLTGIVSLRRLHLEGNNWFSLSWTDSPNLTIQAKGQSYVQIAGITNRLDAELWDHTRFNAKYLRVHRSFVKTHDNAVAEITTTAHQHTLATDASDILFYKLPKSQTNFMAFDGAVLDMRQLNDPNIDEPDATH